MKLRLSEAIESGVCQDVAGLSLPRFGFVGDISDRQAVATWLRAQPVVVDFPWVEAPPPRTGNRLVRPEQAAFREAVGRAYGWRCALSGCDEVIALQAAHLRDWADNNTVCDGVLLRADLHLLFDGGKLAFEKVDDGKRYVARVLSPAYQEFEGRQLRLPKAKKDWPLL